VLPQRIENWSLSSLQQRLVLWFAKIRSCADASSNAGE
jgi:hypothetical protein